MGSWMPLHGVRIPVTVAGMWQWLVTVVSVEVVSEAEHAVRVVPRGSG